MDHYIAFFGAFNPPTKAHVELSEYAMKMTESTGVIFVPSKASYVLNDQKKDSAFSDRQRLLMLNEIARNRSWMKVSDFELKSMEQPKTYHTLCFLRSEGYDCSLLIGSDKLNELETGWTFVDEICDEFGIVAMSRDGDNCERMLEENPYLRDRRKYIRVVKSPDKYSGISSSRVRSLLSKKHGDRNDKTVEDELKSLICPEIWPLEKFVGGEND